MSVATSNEARPRVVRWLEESQGQLSAVLASLHDYDRVPAAAQMAEQECERLRAFVYENERLRNQIEGLESECGKLREEIPSGSAESSTAHDPRRMRNRHGPLQSHRAALV